MKYKLIELTDTMIEESDNLLNSFSSYFELKSFRYVDFTLKKRSLGTSTYIYYSKNHNYWAARYKDRKNLIHVFGKLEDGDLDKAISEFTPLKPSVIFSLPIAHDNTGAFFARKDDEVHLMSNVYDIPITLRDQLIKEGLIFIYYPNVLFDFGNCLDIESFLRNIEKQCEKFNFKFNSDHKLNMSLKKEFTVSNSTNYNYCMVCGNELNSFIPKKLKEYSKKYLAKCEKCLEKIYVLDAYYKLYEDDFIDYISKDSIKYDLKGEFSSKYVWNLLEKYDMLEEFSGDLFKLKSNETIEKQYKPFLKPLEKEEIKRKPSRLEQYLKKQGVGEKEEEIVEERYCKICGKTLKSVLEEEYCSECYEKISVFNNLKLLLEYVSPGKGFSKNNLIKKYFEEIELNLIFNDLLKENLLISIDDNDLFILNETEILNDFIRTYGDEEYLMPEDGSKSPYSENKPQVYIGAESLKSEDALDAAINLFDFKDYVESSYNKALKGWFFVFKRDGEVVSKKIFISSFRAKLSAVKFLRDLGLVKIFKTEESEKEVFKVCRVCGNEFLPSNKSQKYCKECTSKYSSPEIMALIGINDGRFTKGLANEIQRLQKAGKTNKEISKIFKINNSNLINPILRFLVPGYKEEIELKEKNKPLKPGKAICAVCGKRFKKNNSAAKYCLKCKSKFNKSELTALISIKNGEFDKDLFNSVIDLKDKNLTDKEIAKELGIKYPSLVSPIIKFLSDDGLPKELMNNDDFDAVSSQIDSTKHNYDSHLSKVSQTEDIKIASIKDGHYTNVSDARTCELCGNVFYPRTKFSTNQKYCEECRKKYNSSEINVLVAVKNGEVDPKISNEIQKGLLYGLSRKEITNKYNLKSTDWINIILRFYPPKEELLVGDYQIKKEENARVCECCGESFYPRSKFSSSQKYCDNCTNKYSSAEINVLKSVRKGELNPNISEKVQRLLNEGCTKKETAEKTNLKSPTWIEPILKFYPPTNELKSQEVIEDVTYSDNIIFDENTKKWNVTFNNEYLGSFDSENEAILERNKYLIEEYRLINQIYDYIDRNDSYLKPYKKLNVIKDGNRVNLELDGLISDNARFSLFSRFSFLNENNINEIRCKKVGENFKVHIDLKFNSYEAKEQIDRFKSLGWK